MNIIERFKLGRKIRMSRGGDNSNSYKESFATYDTANGQSVTIKKKDNGDGTITYSYESADPSKYLDLFRTTSPSAPSVTDVLKQEEIAGIEPVIETLVLEAPKAPVTKKTVVTRVKKPIDWKARNTAGIRSVIKNMDADYWGNPQYLSILQQNLIDAGYNVGNTGADGKWGNNTANAIRQALKDRVLLTDGTVNKKATVKTNSDNRPVKEKSNFTPPSK